MNTIVSINGVIQPASTYRITETEICFARAPAAMVVISISNSGHEATMIGNGFLFRFYTGDFFKNHHVKLRLNRVYHLLENPAIAESLEKLQVLVNLIEETVDT